MGPLAVLPVGPMAIEQPVGEMDLELRLLSRVVDLLVAGRIGAALGIHVRGESEPAAVRGKERPADSSREVRLLPRLPAVQGQEEDLRGPGAGGDEGQGPAVGREARRRVGLVGMGQRPSVAAVGVDAPELRPALHGREVGSGELVDDALAVRGQDGLLDALQPVEVANRERALRRHGVGAGAEAGDAREGQGE